MLAEPTHPKEKSKIYVMNNTDPIFGYANKSPTCCQVLNKYVSTYVSHRISRSIYYVYTTLSENSLSYQHDVPTHVYDVFGGVALIKP